MSPKAIILLSSIYLLAGSLAANCQPVQDQSSSFRPSLNDGRFLLSQKRFSEAAIYLTKYAQRYSDDPLGYFLLGTLADESGDFERAVPLYAKSLNLAKSRGMDSADLRINLGNTLLKLNYYDEAIFDYKRALEIDERNQTAHLCLGKVHLLKGDYREALAEFNRCRELGLEEPTLHLLRALALKDLGESQAAQKEAGQYLEGIGSKTSALKKIVLDLF